MYPPTHTHIHLPTTTRDANLLAIISVGYKVTDLVRVHAYEQVLVSELHDCDSSFCIIKLSQVLSRSHVVATTFFSMLGLCNYHLRALLFEGGIYLFGKPSDINDGWIRYVRVKK